MPQRQGVASKPPSPLVFFPISTHFTATPGIPLASLPLQQNSFECTHRLSPCLLHPTCLAAYAPFTPSNSGQRSPPTCYRGCWHVVCRGFLAGYRHFILPLQQRFTIRRPSSLTRRRWVRLAPIAQYSPLLPPVGVWTVSQFQCGRPTSQSGYPSSPW